MAGLVADMVQASGKGMPLTTQYTFLGSGKDPATVMTSNALQGNKLDHMMSTVGAGYHKQKKMSDM